MSIEDKTAPPASVAPHHPDTPDPKRPLQESEAEEFVKRCVHRLIAKYAAMFGIVNLLAIGGLFYSVIQTANVAAKSEAANYADRALESQVHNAGKIIDEFVNAAKKATDTALDRIGDFDKAYPSLLATKERLETDLQTLQNSLATVKILADKASISQLESLALALKSYNESGHDVSKMLGGLLVDIDSLKASLVTSQGQLVATLAQKVSKDELQAQLMDKMSTQKAYRIRSEIGDWFACVNDGKGHDGSAMGIAPLNISYPSNKAVWWTFQALQ